MKRGNYQKVVNRARPIKARGVTMRESAAGTRRHLAIGRPFGEETVLPAAWRRCPRDARRAGVETRPKQWTSPLRAGTLCARRDPSLTSIRTIVMAGSKVVQHFDPPFEILMPARLTAPILFNSPHSGSVYPESFLAASKLDALTLRRSEDCYVDELFAGVVERGAPLMLAHFPRAYVDVNREPYELDPEMFCEPLPEVANTRSLRVAGGLGTIPRVVSEAAEIYAAPLTLADAQRRIEELYKPYHDGLSALLGEIRQMFGAALLIDCHSMPSLARDRRPVRPDFVLGDRFSIACAPEIVDAAERSLKSLGYSVTCNRPYAGGYITQRYGAPRSGFHALQIEINRALYVNEQTLEKSAGFEELADNLLRFSAAMMDAAGAAFSATQCAAE
jgi:N-formylglutamate amidohydrolase